MEEALVDCLYMLARYDALPTAILFSKQDFMKLVGELHSKSNINYINGAIKYVGPLGYTMIHGDGNDT